MAEHAGARTGEEHAVERLVRDIASRLEEDGCVAVGAGVPAWAAVAGARGRRRVEIHEEPGELRAQIIALAEYLSVADSLDFPSEGAGTVPDGVIQCGGAREVQYTVSTDAAAFEAHFRGALARGYVHVGSLGDGIDAFEPATGPIDSAREESLLRFRASTFDDDGPSAAVAPWPADEARTGEPGEFTARLVETVHRLAVAIDRDRADLTRERGMTARLQKENRRLGEAAAAADKRAKGARASEAEALRAAERSATVAAEAQERLHSLRASATYQAGQALRAIARNPLTVFRLPVALARAARSRPDQTAIRGELAPAVLAAPAAEPAPNKPVAPLRLPAPAPDEYVPPLEVDAEAILGRQGLPPSSNLRIAAIMDEFTYNSFAPEADIVQLLPQEWEEQLDAHRPELVFIESAWRGKDGAWGNQVAVISDRVRGIFEWCRLRGVPAVFWNKEDPVHWTTFINTAKLADFVFTTDIDCIDHYKSALGHDRVFLLPFACQPVLHNPLATFARKEAFSFAGAYYVRYPERVRDLEDYCRAIPDFMPIEIFDRNYYRDDPNYAFPPEFSDLIVGTLPPEEMAVAYKGYTHTINLNSVKMSQSMFARRVFELAASNSLVVSNYSRGLWNIMGELVTLTDSGQEAVERSRDLDGERGGLTRAAALRKVMSAHTYRDRLDYILAKVGGENGVPVHRPKVLVVAFARDVVEASTVIRSMGRQRGVSLRGVVIVPEGIDAGQLPDGVTVMGSDAAADVTVGEFVRPGEFLASMSARDGYGSAYLLDLALGARYSRATVAAKQPRVTWTGGGLDRSADLGPDYTAVHAVPVRAAMFYSPENLHMKLADWAAAIDSLTVEVDLGLLIDGYEYCVEGSTVSDGSDWLETVGKWCSEGTVGSAPYAGMDAAALLNVAESIEARRSPEDAADGLDGAALAALLPSPKDPDISMVVEDGEARFSSTLGDGKHQYIYAREFVPLDGLVEEGRLTAFIEASVGLNLQMAFIFYNDGDDRLSSKTLPVNRNLTIDVPDGATRVKLAVRVHSRGTASIVRLVWGHRSLVPAKVLTSARNVVVTNSYPSYDSLYRNAFVHGRVREYIKADEPTEVFVLQPGATLTYREFEGVQVVTGDAAALTKLLEAPSVERVLVHFVNESIWEAIRHSLDGKSLRIWVHGADIQPWWRRPYLYEGDEARQNAEVASQAKLDFWRRLFDEVPASAVFVFVSQSFAEDAFEDMGARLPNEQVAIIHNPINTDLFAYRQKSPEDRLRILSIRPYASAVYANDLTVEAIRLLSEKPYFPELSFTLIGDGPLFEETVAPLASFDNVTLDRRFLRQSEIADEHGRHGVFLVPTRMDTQGVSRDEAMSSGLVPVTTRIAAVPEFVDETCGILTEPESAEQLADAIGFLYHRPDAFLEKSENAAIRVRKQSAGEVTILQELEIIRRL